MRRQSGSRTTATPAELRERIRETGLRSTAPRIAVLDRLQRADSPLSHGEITEELMPLGFDRATIYRNLTDLAEAGLVSRVEVGDHVWRFELRQPDATRGEREHPHFVCNDCGTVACLPSVSVNIRPARGAPRSIVAEVNEVVLRGRCEAC